MSCFACSRKLRLESLEERTLLAVMAGQGAAAPEPVGAAVWVVNTTADPANWDSADDQISLREAVAAAGEGDTVTFAPELAGKTILLSGSEIKITKGIAVDAAGIGGITIDAGGKSRVFYISGGTQNTPVELSSLAITGGSAAYGGGICNYSKAVLTMTNCLMFGNSAERYGGGIENRGTVSLCNCTIAGNSAQLGGGTFSYSNSNSNYYNTVVLLNFASGGDRYSDVYNKGAASAFNTLSAFTAWTVSEECPAYDAALPLFTDPENGDFTLPGNSQAVNRGNNSYISGYETDLAGNLRIVGGVVDLGAYEVGSETPSTVVTTELDIADPADNQISLREAVAYAGEGDTVTFAPELAGKTILLNGSEIQITKGITVDAAGIGGITIDAGGKSRVFYISGGTQNTPVELSSLAITGGSAAYGGGICNYSKAVLTMTNCLMFGNSAERYGGGIENRGTVSLYNCTIAGNSAQLGGGTFSYSNSNSNYYNTVILLNSASGGDRYSDVYNKGAASAFNTLSAFTAWTVSEECPVYDAALPLFTDPESGDFTLTRDSQAVNRGNNSYISGYETDLAGNPRIVGGVVDLGAYEVGPETPSTVVTTELDIVNPADNQISLREAIAYAGEGDTVTFAPELAGKTILLSGSEIQITKGITVDAAGIGGITIDAGGKSRVFYISGGTQNTPVELSSLAITGGSAAYGGGICNYSKAVLTMTNCLMFGNSAERYGGGIENRGTVSLYNCTIAGNSAQLGGGTFSYSNSNSNYYNTVILLNSASGGDRYSDVYNKGAASAFNTLSAFTAWTVSEECPAYDAALPLFTDPENGDFTLTGNSQAVNRGNNSYISGYETDLAGNLRIVGGVVDLGAYEVDPETLSTVVTTELDIVDPADNQISLREAVAAAGEGDTVTFAPELAGKTILLNGSEIQITKGITVDAAGIGGITIDAGGKSRVFKINSGAVLLSGLTLENGYHENQGGAVYNAGDLTLDSVTVSGSSSGKFGGAVYTAKGSCLTVTDSVFTGNTASTHGGAVMVEKNAQADISGSYFCGNTSGAYGSAVYVWNNAAVRITDTLFAGNSALYGTIRNYGGTLYMVNVVLSENIRGLSSGSNGVNTAVNVTISNNTRSAVSGDGSASLLFYNSIILGGRTVFELKGDSTVGGDTNLSVTEFGTGFIPYDGGDLFAPDGYSLAEDSQAIDKGDNSYISGYETDLAGNPRIVGAAVDLGACEYQYVGGRPGSGAQAADAVFAEFDPAGPEFDLDRF